MVSSGVLGLVVMVLLGVSILVALAGLIAFVLLALADEPTTNPASWHREVESVARESRAIAAETTPLVSGRRARDLSPLGGRLRRLARTAPESVDDRTVQLTFELGVACQAVGLAASSHDIRLTHRYERRLDGLQDQADALVADLDEAG